MKSEFEENGFIILDNVIEMDALENAKKTFEKLLSKIFSLRLKNNDNNIFKSKNYHQKIMYLSKHYPYVLTDAINSFHNSLPFFYLCFQKKLIERLLKDVFVNTDSFENLMIIKKNFRIDLPSSMKKEKKNFSLGWHQESAYFQNNVSLLKGIIVWVPLFDVKPETGGLLVIPGSQKDGPLKHHGDYLNKIEKKHLRTFVNIDKKTEKKSLAISCKAGDAVILNFNLLHSSGENRSEDFVRTTFQTRISDFCSSDFNFNS